MGYAIIALDNPKNKVNIGHAMRACGVFGAAALAIGGKRKPSWITDPANFRSNIPLFRSSDVMDLIPNDCIPIAIELIGPDSPWFEYSESLIDFKHPPRAFYVFGPEDATLGKRVFEKCKHILHIPVGCLNLAAAVNVVLYDRLLKEQHA